MIHTKAQLLACALAALSWLSFSAHLVSSSSSERDRALTTNSWVLVTFKRKEKHPYIAILIIYYSNYTDDIAFNIYLLMVFL